VAGQFVVGRVEARSPAAAAGLLDGDHLIQVVVVIIITEREWERVIGIGGDGNQNTVPAHLLIAGHDLNDEELW